ncbi:MAG TPA: NAD(P)/FAD-dependent oxidoreductase, partial [Anaerolineales bacterium]|nr:NAD(P)/FAD-dependent oxidoreductase [Anaerolineales bacterium]
VTIIGAGLAGLAAAYDLHRGGCRVIVLEARPRVGGRVYSLRTFSNGLVAEAGGEFIEDSHARMLALAKQFKLQLGRLGSWQGQEGDWGSFEGKTGPMSDAELWGTDLRAGIEKIWVALAELGKQVPDPHQPQAAQNAIRLDARSAADWLGALDAHPLAKSYFVQHIRAEYTTEPERYSLLDLARNSAMYYGTLERRPNWCVVGGNDLIPRALAQALPDVRLDAVVTSINAVHNGVVTGYKTGNSFRTISSDFAILAIPLTAARRIRFDPQLPDAHRRMVNEVSYGAVSKVMIEYRKRFWNDRGWNGRLATDAPIVYAWHATSHVESEHGILTAYTGGGPGERLAALPDEERIRAAVAEVERVFPGSSEWIEHTATLAWPNESYTQGSYMALAPGQVTAHWQTLFEPAGRLFFAGEHATALQGFMEGAVESGQRAAANILSS